MRPQWAATNQELLGSYGYTNPDITESFAMINIELGEKDVLLPLKQKLFSIGYSKKKDSEVLYGVRIASPLSEMDLHRIITPFRINAWVSGPKYMNMVIYTHLKKVLAYF